MKLSSAQRTAVLTAVLCSDGKYWLVNVRDATVQVLWERKLVTASGQLWPEGEAERARLKEGLVS